MSSPRSGFEIFTHALLTWEAYFSVLLIVLVQFGFDCLFASLLFVLLFFPKARDSHPLIRVLSIVVILALHLISPFFVLMAAKSSHPDVIKEGWLEKKGSIVKSWKRRYFVLFSPTSASSVFSLHYYLDESLAHQRGKIDILSSTRVMFRDGSSHQFKFGVLTGKRLLEIACTSDEHRNRWMTTLQEVVNRIQVSEMKEGIAPARANERKTVFDDMIIKKKIDRTHMEEDTPMNRARKKQQKQMQHSKLINNPPETAAAGGLRQDETESALWGGDDSDLSEEESDEEEESTTNAKSSSNGKKPRRRRAGKASGKMKKNLSAVSKEQYHGKTMGKDTAESDTDRSDGGGRAVRGRERSCSDIGPSSRSQPEETRPLEMSENVMEDWEENVSENGEIYYYHKIAKVTRRDRPTPEVNALIKRRLEEEQRKAETAAEKRKLEQKQNKFVEEELQQYTQEIQHEVTQQIQLWKHPPGKKRPRVLGELLNALPALLGPSVVPPESSLATTPLQKSDPPEVVRKAYRKAVRLVHPDKIAGTGCVIEMEKKMLAEEAFITLSEAFEKFRLKHDV